MDLISLDKKVCLSVPKLNSINLLDRLVVLYAKEKEGERRKRLNLYELQHYMFVKYTAQRNPDCD